LAETVPGMSTGIGSPQQLSIINKQLAMADKNQSFQKL